VTPDRSGGPDSNRRPLGSGPAVAQYEYRDFSFPDLMRIPFHILDRVPIPPLRPALTKALFCSYVELCRASTVLQHTVTLSITCHEQTTAYCTYGRLLSVAMENYADRRELTCLTSSSRRPRERRSLMAVERVTEYAAGSLCENGRS